jgi:hypothetical protein
MNKQELIEQIAAEINAKIEFEDGECLIKDDDFDIGENLYSYALYVDEHKISLYIGAIEESGNHTALPMGITNDDIEQQLKMLLRD